MYTLVIVDMQPAFNAANRDRVVSNCFREILLAIKNDFPILFLEFDGYYNTHQKLMGAVKSSGYANYYVRLKNEDDGSDQIRRVVFDHALPKNFRVCGVNTDCCVASTVKGLAARYPDSIIEVIADACGSDWYHERGLAEIKKLQGLVKVI
jgi:nicotinamidase-related amidase